MGQKRVQSHVNHGILNQKFLLITVFILTIAGLFLKGCRENTGSALAPYLLLPQVIGSDGDRDILIKGRIAHTSTESLFFDKADYSSGGEGGDGSINMVKYIGDSESIGVDPLTNWMLLIHCEVDENSNRIIEYFPKAHVLMDDEDFYFNPADHITISEESFEITEDMIFSARVAPGAHKLRVYAPFFKPYERIIETSAQTELFFNIQLQPVEDYQPNYYRHIIKMYDMEDETEYWQAPIHFIGGRMNYSDWGSEIAVKDMKVSVFVDPVISNYTVLGNPPPPRNTDAEIYWEPVLKDWLADIPNERLMEEARQAFSVWQRESGVVWFEMTDDRDQANIKLSFTGWISNYDDELDEYFTDTTLGYTVNPATWRGRWQPEVIIGLNKCSVTLVENVPIINPESGESEPTDIVYVGAVGNTNSYLTQGERTHVLLHEIGHSLGLTGHSPNGNDIMFSQLTATPWFSGATRKPSQSDINTLKMLYQTVPMMHELGFVVPMDKNLIFPPIEN